jgi:alkanesulfonate monooxygenase SsuD/methylene tetrahydromethanopterin reductase-like flavin-dependent oxidoreductase (luciferase family)
VPLKERVGLVVTGADAKAVIALIVAAEAAGVRQVWMTQGSLASNIFNDLTLEAILAAAVDTLTLFAVAMTQTSSIRMGTAIVPTYPRHPLALVQQTLTIEDLAPGRLRLGVGPSHRPVIEDVYGIPMQKPLEHEREYVEVLRGALWEGKVPRDTQRVA